MAEQQLELIKKGAGRGGARKGSGRKAARAEGSKTMRIPTLYVTAVKALVEELDKATASEVGADASKISMHVTPDLHPLQGGAIDVEITIQRIA